MAHLNADGTVVATVHWTSRDGKYVVIQGPFPHSMSRTLSSKTVEEAAERPIRGSKGIMARPMTRQPHYAKVRQSSIIASNNEYGEVAP